MPAEKIIAYLEGENVDYEIIRHERAYTAQEAAAAAHIPGDQLAKAVMLVIDDQMAMAVLPATYRVNLELLGQALDAQHVRLASEKEFKDRFPDCDVGALPPFGHLYGLKIFADDRLGNALEIAFCAGSHTELLKITNADFRQLAAPVVLNFAYQPG